MNMGPDIRGSRDPVLQSVKKCNVQREHVSVIHAEPACRNAERTTIASALMAASVGYVLAAFR